MRKFINDNFFQLTILAIIFTMCIFTLIHIHQIEKYCETSESNGDWRCVTWGDLENKEV